MMINFCQTYCPHGGVCVLNKYHDGPHTSEYCEWSDEDSISHTDADERLAATPMGRKIIELEKAIENLIHPFED